MVHQCEQTSQLQDKLTGMLIGLARATENNDHLLTDSTAAIVVEGLCTAATADAETLLRLVERVDEEKRKLVPDCYTCTSQCGRTSEYDMNNLQNANEDVRSLKSLILFGIRGLAACAYHAAALGYKDHTIHKLLYKALFSIGMDDWGMNELLPIALEIGEVNLKCMTMLEKVSTEGTHSTIFFTSEELKRLSDQTGDDVPLDLPISMDRQEAVCILLTLLHLGVRKIRIRPSLPAFLSSNVQNALAEKLGVDLITAP